MKGSTALKGIHSIKSIQSSKKDSECHGENPDFLRLYMLEKERSRLRNERKRLQLRLEPVEARLKEIEEYYTATLGKKNNTGSFDFQDENQDDEKMEWKTVEIKY
jgi:hypothetical protein